jgi:glycosyltransferase involved in cell wall biosynthesis
MFFISKYQLEDVTYIKKRIKNVNEYMMAMDIFALPSLYEGLGIVLIEGQAAGLKCFTTLDTVAEETNLTSNIKYLKLNKKIWVNEILNTNVGYDRAENMEEKCKDFDIKNIAKKLENLYLNY